jgi:hypothetical protein
MVQWRPGPVCSLYRQKDGKYIHANEKNRKEQEKKRKEKKRKTYCHPEMREKR